MEIQRCNCTSQDPVTLSDGEHISPLASLWEGELEGSFSPVNLSHYGGVTRLFAFSFEGMPSISRLFSGVGM